MKTSTNPETILTEALAQLRKLDPAWKIVKCKKLYASFSKESPATKTRKNRVSLRGPNKEAIIIQLSAKQNAISYIEIEFPKNTFTQEYDGMLPEYPFWTIILYHPINWDLVRDTITTGQQATKTLHNLTKLQDKENRREHQKRVAALGKLGEALTAVGIQNEIDKSYLDYEALEISDTYLRIYFKNNEYFTNNLSRDDDEYGNRKFTQLAFLTIEDTVQWVRKVFSEEKQHHDDSKKRFEEEQAENEAEEKAFEEKKRLERETRKSRKAMLESEGDSSGK